jgi:RHS repeat-associated protein
MHSRRPLFASRLHPLSNLFRQVSACGWQRRALCLVLIFGLLMVPDAGYAVSAATEVVVQVAKDTVVPVPVAVKWFRRILRSAAKPRRRDTLADRVAQVAHIQVSPPRFVGYLGQSQDFSALPTNNADQTIQGVKFSWESSNPEKVAIDDTGHARFLQPGLARLTCRAGTTQATVRVLVRPGQRPHQSDAEWLLDQGSLNETTTTSTGRSGAAAARLPTLLDRLAPTAQAQVSWPDDFGYDELYSEPRNLVGSPRHRAAESTRLGAVLPEGSNFEFAVPIIGLGGRGLGTGLTLYYNSRVWSRRNNAVAFDAITGWPGPGFSLGFGRVVFQATGFGGDPPGIYLLIDPDGTRHYLGSGTWAGGSLFQTTDGSQVKYVGNARYGGTLVYQDGTNVMITPVNNRLVPTQIFDRNGNLVEIAYKPDCYTDQSGTHCGVFPPASIDYITDSLGRIIQFQYDASGYVTSISAPGFGGTAQNPVAQTLVRFDYQSQSPSYNFSGLIVEHVGGNGNNLRHVYFPATNTGFLFTYSGYGMIYNVSVHRQMAFNQWPVTPVGIQDGVESASIVFNYPISGSTQVTDVPAFTQRTENATNAPQSVYSYATSTNGLAQTKTFTITQPDTTTVSLTRSTNTSSVANGLLVESEAKIGSASLAKTSLTYANDGGGSPQVQSVISYDDTGVPVKADFDYDSTGNLTNRREYGVQVSSQWQVRRRAHFTYTTISSATNLVTEADVYDALLNSNDADDVLIAKTTCTYDNYTAMGGMEDYGGTASPPGRRLNWGTNVTARANVTGVTEWTDLQANTVITHLAKYDIFGNVVKAQVSCCQEKDMTNTDATYWSQPDAVTSGDPNGVHETTSTDYDFNTSLPTVATDAAGLQSSFGYDATLRPNSVQLPTGATAQSNMNYGTLTLTDTQTYDDGGTQKTITSTTQYDGWMRVIQTVAANNAQVNTAYDAMGRTTSQTNPFTAGDTPGPTTTTQYDLANKAVVTTLPDSNTVRSDYSSNTVTITDQVNRKMKREMDGLGRLVKVTEQDGTGALTQETSYTYSLLNKLTQVNQGNQLRSFKYDAKGRMLYEKLPEQTATIDDGTGTYWTSKYTYTEFNAVATRQDARGVVTTYGYDALHRLTSVSYNTVFGVTTAPQVSYIYDSDPSYGTSAPGQMVRVTVGSDYQERYTFDSLLRVSSTIRQIGTRSYTTSYNSYNEAGQLTQMTYPSGQALYPSYDAIGRLSSLTNYASGGSGTAYLSQISYNLAGQMTGDVLGNGVTEQFGYDANRLQMTSQKAGTISPYTDRLNLTYSYNASAGQMGTGTTAGNAGQLVAVSGSISGTTEMVAYTYDNYGRLATSNQVSNGASAQRRFAYDRWGNRTSVWDATAGGNQIQSISLVQSGGVPTNRISSVTTTGTVNYSYDASGNVTNDGSHSYTYDSENRLVNLDSGVASYAYDHQNRRYKKTVGLTVTHYVWEGAQVLSEHNGSTGAVQVDYIQSGSRLLAKVAGGTMNYLLSDRLSVRVMMSASGAVVGRQSHLPYGEDFAESGTQQKQHFTNYESDSESGSDYAVNRQYNANIGRFNRVDPLTSSARGNAPQSWNRYSYAHNEPIDQRDPLGLDIGGPGPSPGEPPHPVIPGDPFAHEHGPCPAWQQNCDLGPSGFSGSLTIAPLLSGSGNGEGAGDPIVISPPELRRTCTINVLLKGGQQVDGTYSSPGRYGYVTTTGAKEITTSDGFWGYTFEVQVKLPSGDNDPNNWDAIQWIGKIGLVIIMYQGHPYGVDKSAGGNGPTGTKADNPFEDWIDRTQTGYLFWVDTPDIRKVADDPDGHSQPVESGGVFFRFIFEAHNKKDSTRNCKSKPITFALAIEDRKGTW